MAEDSKSEDVRITQGRSPAYPYCSLPVALEKVEKVRDAGAVRQAMPPETFYKIWGVGAQSSGARQTMAALNHFGLVDYVGRGNARKVQLSEMAKQIVLDKEPNSTARAKAIREAALTPAIHKDMWEKYGSFLPVDAVIETFLVRDLGYNDGAAKALIREYKDTMEFSGLDKPEDLPDNPNYKPEKLVPEVGDLVQVEINGAFTLANPARVRGVREHEGSQWVFIEGSETGVLMEQVVVQEKGSGGGKLGLTPPTLSLGLGGKPVVDTAPTEREWLRGPLSKESSYRLIVSGDLGPREIGKLIKLLKAQQAVLSDDDDDGNDEAPE